jgi:hypothetical protein
MQQQGITKQTYLVDTKPHQQSEQRAKAPERKIAQSALQGSSRCMFAGKIGNI